MITSKTLINDSVSNGTNKTQFLMGLCFIVDGSFWLKLIPLIGHLNGLTFKFSDINKCENTMMQLFRGNYGFSLLYKITSTLHKNCWNLIIFRHLYCFRFGWNLPFDSKLLQKTQLKRDSCLLIYNVLPLQKYEFHFSVINILKLIFNLFLTMTVT